ncbi:hypothetical protein CLV78_11551 [Aliiruegeria haliotis]|uniref:Uncharacterized protein n=1 Tax=Aliiruegeria haliotis TaxID=1280846 RepID=A0A2T0RG44_9RHOB|nr:hypothetical protein [Aliiruegeria haliotis]PRY20102.1 hypothetical protein CLV78_11551 [Aliiruegeria haliotis]
MSVTAALEASLRARQVPTLVELGGVPAILADRDAIIDSPFFDILLQSIGAGGSEDHAALLDFVIDGFLAQQKPLVFRDAVNSLLANRDLRQITRPKLVGALQARIDGKAMDDQALLAAFALEGLFQLALDDDSTRWRTLIVLNDLQSDDPGIFVRHAAKIAGVAYHHWRETSLRDALVRLQANDEAEDEATFELAMIAFADALNGHTEADVGTGMREARGLFKSVLRRNPARLDASIYVAVIDVVLAFTTKVSGGLGVHVETLGRLLAERHDQLGMGDVPGWLEPRVDREVEWWQLLCVMRSVASSICRPSWLNAGRVMEQVLAVYDAEQTIAVGGGLNILFAPKIEAAFIRERGLAGHLHELLADSEWAPEYRPIAEKLCERIALSAAGDPPSRLEWEGGNFPRLSAILQDSDASSRIPDDMAVVLERSLADKNAAESGKHLPDVQKICKRISGDFVDAIDYRGEIKHAYDQLIRQVVVFCEDRQHADLAQLGERGAYLRSADAVENDLQRDLREWLRGNMSPVKVLPEVPGIAAGRSDLYVDFGNTQFIIELKRHFGAVDADVARTYRAQAVAYQATGPKLGVLGILELAERPGPPPSLTECVWTEAYVPEGSHLTRHLVVFRVPGMLKTPSRLK